MEDSTLMSAKFLDKMWFLSKVVCFPKCNLKFGKPVGGYHLFFFFFEDNCANLRTSVDGFGAFAFA
jgi:hypothetical protein